MTADELINEYKELPKNCFQINYGDDAAIKRNNESVKRMYKILKLLKTEFGAPGIEKIKPLLDIEDYRTNLWVATQLLEKVELDFPTEKKALSVIEKFAKSDDLLAEGYKVWLKNWRTRHGNEN